MGTSMEHAFQNSRNASSKPASEKKKASTPAVLTPAELDAAYEERLAKLLAQPAEAAADDNIVEAIVSLKLKEEDLLQRTVKLDATLRQSRKDSVDYKNAQRMNDQLTDLLRELQSQLQVYTTKYSTSHVEAIDRFNHRKADRKFADEMSDLSANPKSVRNEVFNDLVNQALEQKLIATGGDTFSWNNTGYGPGDYGVSATAEAMAGFLKARQDLRRQHNSEVVNALKERGCFVSAVRPKNNGVETESELDKLRDSSEVVRSLTAFLSGQGKLFLAHVKREVVVLERRDNDIVAVKVSGPITGEKLFYRYDNTRNERVMKDNLSVFSGVTADDLSKIWYADLRLSLEETLRREEISSNKRDAANALRNITGLNAVTLDDLAEKKTGVAVVSILYRDPETERNQPVTFRVEGNGKTFQVTGTVPGTETTIKRVRKDRTTKKVLSSRPFLTDFIGQETPVEVLSTDPVWTLIRGLNKHNERKLGLRKSE